MNYFNTNKIRRTLSNTTKDSNIKSKINSFFSNQNIFNNLDVKKVYIPKDSDEIHISQDDFEKIILLASLKLKRTFKAKAVGIANQEIFKEMEEFKVSSLSEVNKIISLKIENNGIVKITEKLSMTKEALKNKLLKEIPDEINKKRILSIDFEFSNKNDLITEMGITIKDGEKIVSKHYLIKGAYQIKSDLSLQKRFRFGKTEKISVEKMQEILKEELNKADYCVFHSYKEDIRLLGIYGIWISDYQKVNILDTQILNGKITSLQSMLDKYEINHTKKELHNSGNDAYYTIKLLENMIQKDKIHKNRNKIIFN